MSHSNFVAYVKAIEQATKKAMADAEPSMNSGQIVVGKLDPSIRHED